MPVDVVQRYWLALEECDADAMAACYADDAHFRDPIFELHGQEIGKMWKGLFGGAKDLRITTEPLTVTGGVASGYWYATYTFTSTGRLVHNVIRSEFHVQDGKIIEQRDHFPFWKWSRMALGTTGTVLGWTPIVRNKVRKMAAKRLQ